MKNVAHIIVVILTVLLLLTGCTKPNDLEAAYVLEYYNSTVSADTPYDLKINNTTPNEELITKMVDIHFFAQLYSPYGNKRMKNIINDVEIECLRHTTEGAFYSVHKVKQGGLLYVFYDNYDRGTDISEKSIIRWFYVNKLLSFSDFEDLTENLNTIDDVISINPAEQIFLNIFRADTEIFGDGVLYTSHYLKDGILDIGYKTIDGKLMLTAMHLTEDFDCPDLDEPVYRSYNARIFDFDWLE